MRGFFLTLEGPEGSGKSTQARLILSYLRRRRIPYIHTREPGGTKLGELIRRLLLDPAHAGMCAEAEVLLYEAIRAEHVRKTIEPALKAGKVVVCERFSLATLAYQGFGRGLPFGDLKQLDRFATGGRKPDLTLLLDIPAQIGLKKAMRAKQEFAGAAGRGDRIEQAGLAFHRRVRRGYLELARRLRYVRLIPIQPGNPADGTFDLIRPVLEKKLQARNSKRTTETRR